MNERIAFLDTAKGFGILLMIIGHTLYLQPNHCSKLNAVIYTFHMPMFLMITGYFFKPLPLRESLSKYIRNLVNPCVLTLLLTGLIIMTKDLFGGNQHKELIDFGGRCLALSGFHDNICFPQFHDIGPLWYLFSLTVGGVILCYSLNLNKIVQWGLVLLSFVVSSISVKMGYRLPWCLQQGLSMVFFLYVGFLYKSGNFLKNGLIVPKWGHVVFGIIILVTIRMGGIHISACHYPLGILSAIGGCLMASYVIWFLQKYERYFILLNKIGRFTLSILCAHSMMVLMYYEFGYPMSKLKMNSLLLLFLSIFVDVLGACLIAYVFNRIPLLKRTFNHRNR